MSATFSLVDDVRGAGYAGKVMDVYTSVNSKIVSVFSRHALGVVIVLGILAVVFMSVGTKSSFTIRKRHEKFMPGSTMNLQKLDGLGFSEGLEVAPLAAATAAGVANAAALNVNMNAAAVLADPDLNCANRTAVGDNAWDWMTTVAKDPTMESYANRQAPSVSTESGLSAIMNGQRNK